MHQLFREKRMTPPNFLAGNWREKGVQVRGMIFAYRDKTHSERRTGKKYVCIEFCLCKFLPTDMASEEPEVHMAMCV